MVVHLNDGDILDTSELSDRFPPDKISRFPRSQARSARGSDTAACFPPMRDLGLSDIGSDVAELQRALNVPATG